ncbi:MAG: hypothetical protein AAFP19_15095 [Bacteroidota bacterium]
MLQRNKWLWLVCFVFIFGLTQIHTFFPLSTKTGLWGFPLWLWGMMGVHVLMLLALALFIRTYWKN